MPKVSAGLLMYRTKNDNKVEVFLVHPGGPFYKNKDNLYWSIPKGEVTEGVPEDNYLQEALREFKEETSTTPEQDLSKYIPLGSVKQKSGKIVHAWAFPGELNAPFQSNTFEMEWPPRSGQKLHFPEVDKGEFFDPATAKEKLNPEQAPLIDLLLEKLN